MNCELGYNGYMIFISDFYQCQGPQVAFACEAKIFGFKGVPKNTYPRRQKQFFPLRVVG